MSAFRPTTTTARPPSCTTARSSLPRRRSASPARSTTPAFPHKALDYCLREAGTSLESADLVAFYDKPLIKFERLLETYLAYAPRGIRSFLAAMPVWLKEKLFLKKLLHDELGAARVERNAAEAAVHRASPVARGLCVLSAPVRCGGDPVHGRRRRVGDDHCVASGAATRSTPLWEIDFPHSLGLLYSAFTYFTGFKVNSGEYKLMGLAPYGEPKYVD